MLGLPQLVFPLFVPWNHRWDTAWTHPIVVRWGRSRRWRVEGDRKRPERAGRVLGARHGRVLNEHHHTVNSSECAWHTVDEEVVLRECDASGSVVAPGTNTPLERTHQSRTREQYHRRRRIRTRLL